MLLEIREQEYNLEEERKIQQDVTLIAIGGNPS